MLSFISYFAYVYIGLPLIYRLGYTTLYNKKYWYDICPIIKCIQPLSKCLKESQCKSWLDELSQCNNVNSDARLKSSQTFDFVQHPYDPSYCHYQSFDLMKTQTSIDFVDCIGNSGCLKPSLYTDVCATIPQEKVLPFDSLLMKSSTSTSTTTPTTTTFLKGKWKKLYTTGWDIWPCQYTEFSSPLFDTNKQPESWMTNWPNEENVWRMDLYWKNNLDGNLTFHMSNEMYPGQYWDFSSQQQQQQVEVEEEEEQDVTTKTQTPEATLKTRAIMWGTEAHENWYLLHVDVELQIIIVYYCAHTEAVNRFDSMTMVLQKIDVDDDSNNNNNNDDDGDDVDMMMRMVAATSQQQKQLTDEQRQNIEMKANEILGDEHGKLQRIDECR